MPEYKKGETRQEWMSRCVSLRRKEHPSEKNEQSVAVCFSMWRERQKKAKAELKEEVKDE